MLVRFTVENFMSFRDKTEFNMLTSPEAKYRRHKHHVTTIQGVELLRAAAIYGANGSGKSNLVKAMTTFFQLFTHSKRISEIPFTYLEYHFKLAKDADTKPSILIAEITVGDDFYEFGIELYKYTVQREWLIKLSPSNQKEDFKIYERTTDNTGKTELVVNESLIPAEEDRIRFSLIAKDFKDADSLILPKLYDRGISSLNTFYNAKSSILVSPLSISESTGNSFLLQVIHESPPFLESLNEFITNADIGIKKVDVKSSPLKLYLGENDRSKILTIETELKQGNTTYDLGNPSTWAIAVKENDEIVVKTLIFYHENDKGELVEFTIWNESEGTLIYLGLIFLMAVVLDGKTTIILDEIEKSMHPLLVTEVIKKVMSEETVKGQLIFTTHETQLLNLDIFRQDEIWFTEKDTTGATHIHPLSDYNPRYDLDVQKGYLQGRFGGIPFLGNLEDLSWNKTEPEEV